MSKKKFLEAVQNFAAAKSRVLNKDGSDAAFQQFTDAAGKVTSEVITRESAGISPGTRVFQSTLRDYAKGEITHSVVTSQKQAQPDGSVLTAQDVKSHLIDKHGNELRDEYKNETLTRQAAEGTYVQSKVRYPDGTAIDTNSMTVPSGESTHTRTQTEVREPNGDVRRSTSETVSRTVQDSAGNLSVHLETRGLTDMAKSSHTESEAAHSQMSGLAAGGQQPAGVTARTTSEVGHSESSGRLDGRTATQGRSDPRGPASVEKSRDDAPDTISALVGTALVQAARSTLQQSTGNEPKSPSERVQDSIAEELKTSSKVTHALSAMRDEGLSPEAAANRTMGPNDHEARARLEQVLDKAGYRSLAEPEAAREAVASAMSATFMISNEANSARREAKVDEALKGPDDSAHAHADSLVARLDERREEVLNKLEAQAGKAFTAQAWHGHAAGVAESGADGLDIATERRRLAQEDQQAAKQEQAPATVERAMGE